MTIFCSLGVFDLLQSSENNQKAEQLNEKEEKDLWKEKRKVFLVRNNNKLIILTSQETNPAIQAKTEQITLYLRGLNFKNVTGWTTAR